MMKQVSVPVVPDVGVYLVDYDALIGDADRRNETFLSIIQNTFKESVEEGE